MKKRLKFTALFLILLSSVISILGQDEKSNDFDVIPVSVRERLVERLNLRVEYERTEQWGKLYDLLYPLDIDEETYNKRKEEYIKIHNDPSDPNDVVMISFVPKVITLVEEFGRGTYMIQGCATFKIKDKTKKKNDIIMAHLVDNEWFFSSFGEVEPNKLCEQ